MFSCFFLLTFETLNQPINNASAECRVSLRLIYVLKKDVCRAPSHFSFKISASGCRDSHHLPACNSLGFSKLFHETPFTHCGNKTSLFQFPIPNSHYVGTQIVLFYVFNLYLGASKAWDSHWFPSYKPKRRLLQDWHLLEALSCPAPTRMKPFFEHNHV